MSFAKLLDSDVGLAMVPCLKMKSLLSFMCVSRQCRDSAIFQLDQLTGRKPALSKNSFDSCEILLEFGRLITVDQGVSTLPQDLVDLILPTKTLDPLYQIDKYHKYFFKLNEEMYNNWESLPASPSSGVFDALLRFCSAPAWRFSDANVDAKYWKSSRVYGKFIVLFDRPDGTILVKQDLSAVYKVSNSKDARSIGEIVNSWDDDNSHAQYSFPLTHGPVLGSLVDVVLLNWEDRILQDGALRAVDSISDAVLKMALQAYVNAVDSGSVISELPKVPPAARPEMEEHTDEWLDAFRAKHEADVHAIISQPVSNSKTFSKFSFLKHRDLVPESVTRFTPQDINKVFFVDGKSQAKGYFPIAQLEPTVEDYLAMLKDVTVTSQARPKMVYVDSIQGFHYLQLLLEHRGLPVRYQRSQVGERQILLSAPCEWCNEETQTNMRCSGCALVHYCCREHQAKDWKNHKAFCKRYRKPEETVLPCLFQTIVPLETLLIEHMLIAI